MRCEVLGVMCEEWGVRCDEIPAAQADEKSAAAKLAYLLTPHVTHHTSHATRHTSHATRHTSHVITHLLYPSLGSMSKPRRETHSSDSR